MELKLSEIREFRKIPHPYLMKFKHFKLDEEMSVDLKDDVKVCLVKRLRDNSECIDVTLVNDKSQPIFLFTFQNRKNLKVPMAFLAIEICSHLRELLFQRLGQAGEIIELGKDIYKEWVDAGSPLNGEHSSIIVTSKLKFMNGNGPHIYKSAFIM